LKPILKKFIILYICYFDKYSESLFLFTVKQKKQTVKNLEERKEKIQLFSNY